MGKCTYCGSDAGFLKNKHKACEDKAYSARKKIEISVGEAATSGRSASELRTIIETAYAEGNLSDAALRASIESGLTRLSSAVLEDGAVSQNEETAIFNILSDWSDKISPALDSSIKGGVVKALTLGDLAEGRIVSRFDGEGLPFILKKGEEFIWAFSNVKYFIYKRNRAFVAGSKGVSVRVAKGVYFRTGTSKGRSIVTDDLTHEDTGVFAITSQAVHFKGNTASFRLPYDKLQSVVPFADSLEISDTKKTSKPMYFGVNDPTFAGNVIMNLIQSRH
jgi:hypothetical protein